MFEIKLQKLRILFLITETNIIIDKKFIRILKISKYYHQYQCQY